jgi:peptidoglycan/LPS O-acetylase OafA/YrhL
MPSAASAKNRLAFLDVARGLAALLVLVGHGLLLCVKGEGWQLFSHVLGQIGVILFLVISGFIIPVSLEQSGSNARFWLRRFFRLFPAYWLCILLTYGCARLGVPAAGVKGWDWVVNLTMLQGFFNRPLVSIVFWTLQLELVIYVACSVLFSIGLLNRPAPLAVLALVVYGMGGLVGSLLEDKPIGVGGKRFLYFAPMMGLLAQHCFSGRLARRTVLALVLGQTALVLGPAVYNVLRYPDSDMTWLRQALLYWGGAYTLFFLLLAAHRRTMPAMACWLGRVSYSLYLLHMLVLYSLQLTHWPVWVVLPILFGLSFLVAELGYRFVEVPGIALGRALERRLWPVAAPAPPKVVPLRRAA